MSSDYTWNKDNLIIVVDKLDKIKIQVDKILRDCGNIMTKKKELKFLKDELRSEYKRIQIDSGNMTLEESAFYRPAIQEGFCRFPKLNNPREWHDRLYQVSVDVGYYGHNAKDLLNKMDK